MYNYQDMQHILFSCHSLALTSFTGRAFQHLQRRFFFLLPFGRQDGGEDTLAFLIFFSWSFSLGGVFLLPAGTTFCHTASQ